jgi:hypothetical protein
LQHKNATGAPKTDLFVPMLSPRALTVPGVGGTWCAVRVRPRNEKAFAADMLARGFDFFLPLVKYKDGSRRTIQAPPVHLRGLIFASSQEKPDEGFHVPTELHYFLIAHPAYYGVITVCQSAQRQFQMELEQIHSDIVRSEKSGGYESGRFTPLLNQVCEIRDGAFRGQMVKVTRVLAGGRVEVVGGLVGAASSMSIEANRLDPI